MDAPAIPFTLTPGLSLLRRRVMVGMVALVLALPLALVVALLPVDSLVRGDEALWQAAVAFFRDAAADDPGLVYEAWLLVALLPLGLLALLGHWLAAIRVTPTGIDAHLPRWLGVGLLGQTGGRWRIVWSDIRAARLECADTAPGGGLMRRTAAVQALQAARLVIETDRGAIRLRPFPWYVRGARDHRLGLREVSIVGRLDPRACLARSPLVRALTAQGHGPEWAEAGGGGAVAGGYDLAKHRGMVAQMVLMAVAGLYAVTDAFFLGQFRVLDALPLWPFALVGAGAAVAVGPLGRGAPSGERVAVAALTVAALVAAVYPAMLRLNAWTADPVVVEYTAVAHGRFEAPGDRPAIDLGDQRLDAYWREAVGAGGRHRFTLLQGVFGFRQVDLGPLYERTRAFYREREAPG